MITQTLPLYYLFILFIMLEIGYLVVLKFFLKANYSFKRLFLGTIFIAYGTFLIKFTFFPISFGPNVRSMDFSFDMYFQLVPFKVIGFYLKNLTNTALLVQFVGNIILLVPFSIYLNTIYSLHIKRNIMIGLLITFSIETIQALINWITHYPNKVFDVDDIILNLTGYLLALILVPYVKKLYNSM